MIPSELPQTLTTCSAFACRRQVPFSSFPTSGNHQPIPKIQLRPLKFTSLESDFQRRRKRQRSTVSASPTAKMDDAETFRPEISAKNPDSISAVRRSSSDDDVPDLQKAGSDSDNGKPLLNGPQEDNPSRMAKTRFPNANSTSRPDNSDTRRAGPQRFVEQPITKSADQSSGSDDDIPYLQSSTSDSDNAKPLPGRLWNDSHEYDQSDTEVTSSSATNPCYWLAPYSGHYDTPEEQEQCMNHPQDEPCNQMSNDYLFKVSPSPQRNGIWFALTCVCSLYMFLKPLLIFHNSK